MKRPRDAGVTRWLTEHGCDRRLVARGLDGLLERWARTVTEMEQGYNLTLDDYLNDLDARLLIAGALGAAGAEESARVTPLVAPLDARFEAATVPSRCVWGEATAARERWRPEREWWYWRRPRLAGDDLLADLRAAGLAGT